MKADIYSGIITRGYDALLLPSGTLVEDDARILLCALIGDPVHHGPMLNGK